MLTGKLESGCKGYNAYGIRFIKLYIVLPIVITFCLTCITLGAY